MATPSQILELLGVSESPRIYILGSNEPRVTIYSQQCRALNLIWALGETDQLASSEPTRVAVIGGGIAGVTFAAGIARTGADVVLLEEASRVLHMQAGSHTRWVHPHIYDWPAEGWANPDAGLPVMSWSAGRAGDVVATLRREWEDHVGLHGIEVELNTDVTGVGLDSARPELQWNAPGYRAESFDLIVFAVGFGAEADDGYSKSYWHDDDLHQSAAGTTLISGTGDGGLTDVLRACVTDFEQSELPQLLTGNWVEQFRDDILSLEERVDATQSDITDFYLNRLDAPELRAALAQRAADLVPHVVLNGRAARPFDRRSAPLNRALVAQLLASGLSYQHGEIEVAGRREAGVEIRLSRPDGTTRELSVTRVVRRHGPVRRPIDQFTVTPKLDPVTARRLSFSTDLTRHPAWPPTTFVSAATETGTEVEAADLELSSGPADVAESPGSSSVDDWTVVSRSTLSPYGSSDWAPDFLQFLLGREPQWSDVIPGRAPERHIVGAIGQRLTAALGGPNSMVLVHVGGPSGEGKTTAVMQAAARLALGDNPPTVLWRNNQGAAIPWEAVSSAEVHDPLLVIADHAHDLKRSLAKLTRTGRFRGLADARETPIVFVLCAADVDWNAVRVRADDWGRRLAILEPILVSGLTLEDATAMVRAMEESPRPEEALGELRALSSRDERAQALVASASERQRKGQRASLLGALLEQRGGEQLEDRVRALLARLDSETAESGHSLLRLYLHVGALQFHGLGPIDRDTLAEAADMRVASVERLVGRTLPPEISIRSRVDGWWFRIRHDAIARTAYETAYADPRLREVLRDVHYETVRAVVNLNTDGWRDARWAQVFYLAQRLLNAGADDLAVAAAEGAARGAPRNLYLATALASTYRKAHAGDEGARRGARVLQEAWEAIETYSSETRAAARAFYGEWAACTGYGGSTVASAAGNLVLALGALSDQLAPEPVTAKQLTTGLSEVGRSLLDLSERDEGFDASLGLRAVVALAPVARVRREYANAYRRVVGEGELPTLPDAVSALETVATDVHLLLAAQDHPIARVFETPLRLDAVRAKLGVPFDPG